VVGEITENKVADIMSTVMEYAGPALDAFVQRLDGLFGIS
jgi:hypothetical protein